MLNLGNTSIFTRSKGFQLSRFTCKLGRFPLLEVRVNYKAWQRSLNYSRKRVQNRIKETLRLRAKYQIHDNVGYFLNRIKAICRENYEPNFEDYLRIRTRSTGFAMEKVTANLDDFGQYTFEFTDG